MPLLKKIKVLVCCWSSSGTAVPVLVSCSAFDLTNRVQILRFEARDSYKEPALRFLFIVRDPACAIYVNFHLSLVIWVL